jgi:hypothetical protein
MGIGAAAGGGVGITIAYLLGLVRARWFNGNGRKDVDQALIKKTCEDTQSIVVELARGQATQLANAQAQIEVARKNGETLDKILDAVSSK